MIYFLANKISLLSNASYVHLIVWIHFIPSSCLGLENSMQHENNLFIMETPKYITVYY